MVVIFNGAFINLCHEICLCVGKYVFVIEIFSLAFKRVFKDRIHVRCHGRFRLHESINFISVISARIHIDSNGLFFFLLIEHRAP